MSSSPKRIIRDLERDGYIVTHTNGGHLKILRGDMKQPVIFSGSPSCRRSEKNLRAELRRSILAAKGIR